MTDATQTVIDGLADALRDPECPIQFSPLLMEARQILVRLADLPVHAIGRETVANWMLLRGYTTGHGDTIQDLLFEMEAQAKGRGGPPEPPPGEGDFQLLRGEVDRLRAALKPFAEADWYARGNDRFDGIVSGSALTEAKLLTNGKQPGETG